MYFDLRMASTMHRTHCLVFSKYKRILEKLPVCHHDTTNQSIVQVYTIPILYFFFFTRILTSKEDSQTLIQDYVFVFHEFPATPVVNNIKD